MSGYFKALAVDFDGTLTSNGARPDEAVLAALARRRRDGCRVLLVTGRIISELREVFPDVDRFVDVIVAENGAVIARDGLVRSLAPPVDPELAALLRHQGIDARCGDVLLAADGRHAVRAMEAIRLLGLDAQVVHNRHALMVLPAGVTKGTGLFEALGDLGVSHHSAIGVGDAENDHSLLDVCEVGVAVADAVPALKRHADVVLEQPGGAPLAAFLDGPILLGDRVVRSRRWELTLGLGPQGRPVTLPASQAKVLICGEPGLGKSYVAGLVAERLTALGYCVLVVDPEGDHRELARLRGVLSIDAREGLPDPERVTALLRQRFSSLVIDVSSLDPGPRQDYLVGLGVAVARSRDASGLPHWVILDEAQSAPEDSLLRDLDAAGPHGACLVTYRPGELADTTTQQLDAVIALGGAGPLAHDVVAVVGQVSGLTEQDVRHRAGALQRRQALVAMRPSLGLPAAVTLALRTTPQVRHEHKYATRRLPASRWFYFRDDDDQLVDVATNMADLRSVLLTIDGAVLRRHATSGDLSRWVSGVFQDQALADQVSLIEHQVAASRIDATVARARLEAAVASRYPPRSG